MAVTYYELVVKGNEKLLRGFIHGFKIARGIERGLIFCREHPIKSHHLREVLTFHGDHIHLVTSGRNHNAPATAIEKAEDLEFEIVEDKEITGAYFAFDFETVSKEVGNDLKAALRQLPAGLKLVDFDPVETIDPSAEGVEIYSPVHEYRFRGEGKVTGDLEKLLDFHKKFKEHVFIDVKDIEIQR
jgi:hypothetical protein